MEIYGYARVSSADQNEDRQILAMKEKGVPEKNIFIDKQSGKDFNRPQWKYMIRKLRKYDVLYVLSIDRLGRNYREIKEQWEVITRKIQADIVVIDMPLLDTRTYKDLFGTFIADLVLQILAFVAENERNNIKTRQAQGIAAAKLKGVKFGKPRRQMPDEYFERLQAYSHTQAEIIQIKADFGVSESTIYRHLRELGKMDDYKQPPPSYWAERKDNV